MSDSDPSPPPASAAPSRPDNSPTSLNQRLAAYTDKLRREEPAISKAYDDLVARLGAIERGDLGPAIGDPMPEFLLPNQNGELVALEALLKSGPAVISFNRGHWCPYCALDLHALASHQDRFERLGARLVSIMPDTAHYTRIAIAKNALRFPILSDVDLSYALSLGLIHWIGTEIQEMYQEFEIDLELYQGNGNYFLPTAAKFIVGQDGLIKARQINADFRKRMEPAAIITVLERLRSA